MSAAAPVGVAIRRLIDGAGPLLPDGAEGKGAAGVFAARGFRAGDVVMRLAGDVRPVPSRESFQVGICLHLWPADGHPALFLNHACNPNLAADIPRRVLVARRAILPDEELAYDYNTTEWELSSPFGCHCGAVDCCRRVSGFMHLPPERQRALLRSVAPHLRPLYWSCALTYGIQSTPAADRASHGVNGVNGGN